MKYLGKSTEDLLEDRFLDFRQFPLRVHLWYRLRDRLWGRLGDRLYIRFWDRLGDRLYIRFWDRLYTGLWNHLREEVK